MHQHMIVCKIYDTSRGVTLKISNIFQVKRCGWLVHVHCSPAMYSQSIYQSGFMADRKRP